LRLWVF